MKRGRNCKKNRGREALEKIAKRKCWRKMREGTAGGNRRRISQEGSAGENRKMEVLERKQEENRLKKSRDGSAGGIARRIAEWKALEKKSQERIAGEKRGRESREEIARRNTGG